MQKSHPQPPIESKKLHRIPDPKAVFDIIRNYIICGAIIAVTNIVSDNKYYDSNCQKLYFDTDIYQSITVVMLNLISTIMIFWNSLFACKLIWSNTSSSIRAISLVILLPIIYKMSTLLPLKEYFKNDHAIEINNRNEMRVISIRDKLCLLDIRLLNIEISIKNIQSSIDDGTPVYLRKQRIEDP